MEKGVKLGLLKESFLHTEVWARRRKEEDKEEKVNTVVILHLFLFNKLSSFGLHSHIPRDLNVILV